MFIMNYDEGEGWHDARIVPYGPISLDPAAMCLHYGQEVFEGMKAYKTADGGVQLFIFAVIRSERTRLPCTAGGIILRVKIKYYLFSSERGERHAFAFLIF